MLSFLVSLFGKDKDDGNDHGWNTEDYCQASVVDVLHQPLSIASATLCAISLPVGKDMGVDVRGHADVDVTEAFAVR